ncbi:MAG: cyclin-dependent kinase inhibitor 3 family protein [Trueperaceae bacterium]
MSVPVRTSTTDPIEVFWVDASAHGTPGRLGLTFAPGKHASARVVGGAWQRDLDLDLERLREHHRVDLLVSLMEFHEYGALGIPDLLTRARERGMRVRHLPIADGDVPTPGQSADVTDLVGEIRHALQLGHGVVVHCRGGLGRTGTIVALVVASYGHAPDDAITIVRDVQPLAIENGRQEAYVAEAARSVGAQPRSGAPGGTRRSD